MGRAKEFDENDVLEQAMRVFWQQGYEHTSMQNLVDAMNIHRRSIYDTFGDKHALFIKALDLYEDVTNKRIQEKMTKEMSIHERLKVIFTVSSSREKEYPVGCLIVNSAAELSNVDTEILAKIQMLFERSEHQLFNLLLIAQEKNELSKDTDIEQLAFYLHNALLGLRVLIKTTDNRQKIDSIIEQTLSVVK